MVESDGTSPPSTAEKLRQQLERYSHYHRADVRLQWYIDLARRLHDAEKDKERRNGLRLMVIAATDALRCLQAGDVDSLVQEFDRMHVLRAKLNVDYFESVYHSELGKGKTGKYGKVRRMLMCVCEAAGATDDAAIFHYWQKADPDQVLHGPNGDRWQLEAERINRRQGIDAGQDRPEDFEYCYFYNGAEEPEPVTVGNIEKTLERIREQN